MKSMCCLCIQFTHENTSECTILHLVKKKDPLSKVWLLALQERLAMPLSTIFQLYHGGTCRKPPTCRKSLTNIWIFEYLIWYVISFKRVDKLLSTAMVPEKIEGKYSDKCTKTHVAKAVVLEYSEEKKLFLFPMKGTCMTNLRQMFRLILRIKMKIEICKG